MNFRGLLQPEDLDHLTILVSQADPDILVLTEIWLEKSVYDSDATLNGFNLYRMDRRGGGDNYVKTCFSVMVCMLLLSQKCFELIALKVYVAFTDYITLVS